ncbi:MAG: ATP-binding protein [Bacteroidota bacterium]|nr:ATP-binding protein [Bacteroidota bacterium]
MTVFLFYSIERESIKDDNKMVLNAVSKSAYDQISTWYLDEEEDAELISNNQFFSEVVGRYLKKEVSETVVINFMNEIKTEHLYSDVVLLNLDGKYLTSTNQALAFEDPAEKSILTKAIRNDTCYLSGIYRSEIDHQIYTDFIAVIRNVDKKPLAGLIFKLSPARSLDQLLLDWPLPNYQGKMYLIQKDARDHLVMYDPSLNRKTVTSCWQPYHGSPAQTTLMNQYLSSNCKNLSFINLNGNSLLKKLPQTPWSLYIEMNDGANYGVLHSRLLFAIVIALLLILVCFFGLYLVLGVRQKKQIGLLQHLEDELDDCNNRFLLTMDTIDEGVIMLNAEGLITYMNLEAESITGWKQKDATGKRSEEIIPLINEITGTPVKFTDNWLAEGPAMTNLNQIMLTNKNRSTIYLSCSLTSMKSAFSERSGMILTFHNETEKHRQEEWLQKEERRFRNLFQDAPDAFLIVDEQGYITLANVYASSLFGYSGDELKGLSVEAFMPEPSEKNRAHLKAFLKNPKKVSLGFVERLYIRKKNNQTIPVILSLSPIVDDDKMRIMAIFRDISGMIHPEDQTFEKATSSNDMIFRHLVSKLKKYESQLIDAKEVAEENERLKTAFLANISHEIRTPLNGIIGFSQLIGEETTSHEEAVRYAKIIGDSGTHLLALLNNMVDLSKIDSGAASISPRQFVVLDFIQGVYNQFLPLSKRASLDYKLILPAHSESMTMVSDPVKLNQILSNLIDNAFKFTKKGCIEVGFKLEEAAIVFQVKDSGVGIKPVDRDKIFERFFQSDCSTSRTYEGAGIGLSISKGYATLLGGSIWLDSEPNAGTSFFLKLPCSIGKDDLLK